MPEIRFRKENLVVVVDAGTTILEAAKRIGAPQGDRCGGVCACSTCHVYVVQGLEHTGEIADEEFDILDKAQAVTSKSRLGCQARVHGDIEVDITDESFQAFCDEHAEQRERVTALRKKL